MSEYRCLRCCYRFGSKNEIPYCPVCDSEKLEKIEDDNKNIKFNDDIYFKTIEKESHHIHPKFMDNKEGRGQQFLIDKKIHNILHGKIINWIWEDIPFNLKQKIIKKIISKSKEFLKIKDE